MVFYCWGSLLKLSPNLPLQSVLHASTKEAEDINRLANYFFWAAGFILLVVALLTAYIIRRFRDRSQEGAGALKFLNKAWEIPMIGIPMILVMIFLYLSIATMQRVQPGTDGHVPEVVVTAHQWWWEAVYPNAHVTTANEIHLPYGKRVLLKLLAADVVHDWWIPQFGSKMDMVPTQANFLWVTIKSPGDYYGVCSEFCGAQHAHMRIHVVAEDSARYNSWLATHQQVAHPGVISSAGARLFMTKTCSNCHRIEGSSAIGNAGPDLTHLGSRKTLLAGLLENNRDNLVRWIQHPQQIKPGAKMPDFFLSTADAGALADFLYSMK